MFISLILINNSATNELSFYYLAYQQSSNDQKQSIFCVFPLDCIPQCFYKYRPYHSSIQWKL